MIVILVVVIVVILLLVEVVDSQHNIDHQQHQQQHQQHQQQHQQHNFQHEQLHQFHQQHQQHHQQHQQHHQHHHQSNNRQLKHLDTYPWGGNFDDRQDQLLEELQDTPSITMYSSIIPNVYNDKDITDNKMYIRNVEGLRFAISKHNNDKDKRKEKRITKLSTIKAHLKNTCAVLPAQYWNYEWCFRQEIKQFHLEPPIEDDQQVRRSPEWSLGTYSHSNIIRENNNNDSIIEDDDNASPIVKVIDYFENGQYCYETGEGRQSEIHIQCCDSLTSSDTIDNLNTPKATLTDVTEPNICTYKFTVCTKLLCSKKDYDTHIKNVTLVNVMNELLSSCMIRQEDWWTYELCFNTGIKQFHVTTETQRQENGAIVQVQKVNNHFSLGDAPTNLFNNETALREMIGIGEGSSRVNVNNTNNDQELATILGKSTSSPAIGLYSPILHGKEQLPKSLAIEFTGGTPCDIINLTRSTTVYIFCGQTRGIIDIVEEKTCHYNIKVHSNLVCNYEHLSPNKVEYVQVDIRPEIIPPLI